MLNWSETWVELGRLADMHPHLTAFWIAFFVCVFWTSFQSWCNNPPKGRK